MQSFLLAVLLFGAGAPASTIAAERLAVGASFQGVFEQDSDGRWHGLGVDVLRALAARAGDTVDFKLYPWPRAQAMVERGQAQILIGPYRSAERLKQFNFVDLPFYRDRLVFYARRAGNVGWNGNLGELGHTRIAAVRGWHYGPQFNRLRKELDISEVNQLENGAQMLLYGRVDLLATNERNSAGVLDTAQRQDLLVVACPVIAQLDGYLAFARDLKSTAMRDRYNALFTAMVRSGELARLGARHGVLVPGAHGGAAPPCPDHVAH